MVSVVMNVPNSLTIARIFFVPLLVAVLVEESVAVRLGGVVITNEWLALAIFLAAAGTDLLDGFLARRWGQITTIGTLLDPIADKLLISAALISLVQAHAAPAWMAEQAERPKYQTGQDGCAGGGDLLPAAEHPPSESRSARQLDDVGRGRFLGRLCSGLFPQILAQGRCARQEAAAARAVADGEAGEASETRGARSERQGWVFSRHNLKSCRCQFHHADLAARTDRTDRLSVQTDFQASCVPNQQPHFFGRYHELGLVRLEQAGKNVFPVRRDGDPGFLTGAQPDSHGRSIRLT